MDFLLLIQDKSEGCQKCVFREQQERREFGDLFPAAWENFRFRKKIFFVKKLPRDDGVYKGIFDFEIDTSIILLYHCSSHFNDDGGITCVSIMIRFMMYKIKFLYRANPPPLLHPLATPFLLWILSYLRPTTH